MEKNLLNFNDYMYNEKEFAKLKVYDTTSDQFNP